MKEFVLLAAVCGTVLGAPQATGYGSGFQGLRTPYDRLASVIRPANSNIGYSPTADVFQPTTHLQGFRTTYAHPGVGPQSAYRNPGDFPFDVQALVGSQSVIANPVNQVNTRNLAGNNNPDPVDGGWSGIKKGACHDFKYGYKNVIADTIEACQQECEQVNVNDCKSITYVVGWKACSLNRYGSNSESFTQPCAYASWNIEYTERCFGGGVLPALFFPFLIHEGGSLTNVSALEVAFTKTTKVAFPEFQIANGSFHIEPIDGEVICKQADGQFTAPEEKGGAGDTADTCQKDDDCFNNKCLKACRILVDGTKEFVDGTKEFVDGQKYCLRPL